MEKTDIILKLKEIIIKSMNLTQEPSDLGDEISNLGLNSVDVLEILVWVENDFDIQIDDEDLNASLLRSFEHLADYVISKK